MSRSANYTRNITVVQLRDDIEHLTNKEYVPVFDALDAAIDAQIKRLIVMKMMTTHNTKESAEVRACRVIDRYLRCMLSEDAVMGRLSREDLVRRMACDMADLRNGVV
mgnify:FL=1